ncbi:MAG: RHS repeat-associated core domain-containing protein, partial [Kiritimatiellia bacterium]|nr:RHS repeat-associated core domain-containing protein [Kiritimatiellia bacterium]
RVIATWGATYPVAYEFDAFGRMTAMATTRDNNSDFSTLAVQLAAGQSIMSIGSTWSLDITQWLYDTATGALTNKLYSDGKGPSYTYTADGKLETRNWARGVTTTYTYDTCCAAGSLKSVVYSDGTPGFTNTVDRLGRVVTVTDAQGTRTNVYSAATLALIEEHLPDGAVLTRTQDVFGRASGIALDTDYAVSYDYDSVGRFSVHSAFLPSMTSVVEYAYIENSDLISGWGNGTLSVVRSYENNRDLLTEVLNQAGTNLISRFQYQNDALGRRTQRLDATPSAVQTNLFAYNPRSELVTALMGTNSFGWAFDPIGNRQSSTNNAAIKGYTANDLNQYTSITNGGAASLSYDLDGNLTNDGVRVYVWDGENRLIQVSEGQDQVAFSYDYMSRRVEKIANGVTNRFDYHGWLLVREQSAAGGNLTTSHYVWGLDLSGTMQGVGGIGGLLAVIRNGETYCPVADANGNITEYVNENGTVVAHREFDAYGNTQVATGAMVDDFNFWFSSKYLDHETGVYYYGYRFYNPELGRWLNRDPIGEPGGHNLYGFVSNKAQNTVDFLGLKESCCCYGKMFDPEKKCCIDKKVVEGKVCIITIILGHWGIEVINDDGTRTEYPNVVNEVTRGQIVNYTRKGACVRVGVASCYQQSSNAFIPDSHGYPNSKRKNVFVLQETISNEIQDERSGANVEAKAMLDVETSRKLCCNTVVINLVAAGGDGLKLINRIYGQHVTLPIVLDRITQEHTCKSRGS